MKSLLVFLLFVISAYAPAQVAVGAWRDHLPYRNVITITEAGDKIYAATRNGAFIYHRSDNSIERLTTVEGLSDISPSKLAYNTSTETVVLAYSNGNLDLIKDNRIVNLSFIKSSSIMAEKAIYNIKLINQFAYLACGLGIVVVDTDREEVKETYIIGPSGTPLRVNDVERYQDTLWAATENGLYKAPFNSPFLFDFNLWKKDNTISSPNGRYTHVEEAGNKLYLAQGNPNYEDDSVFVKDNTGWQVFMTDTDVFSIDHTNGRLIFSDNYSAAIYHTDGTFFASFFDIGNSSPEPNQIIWTGAHYFIADRQNGLVKSVGNYSGDKMAPSGPYSDRVFALATSDKSLWVAAGRVSGNALSNSFTIDGAFSYIDGEWKTYNKATNAQLAIIGDTAYDYIHIYVDPDDPNHAFAGTDSRVGLLEFKDGTLYKRYNPSNSAIEVHTASSDRIVCGPVVYDEHKNLWVGNSRVNNLLKVMTPDGTWKSLFCGPPTVGKAVMDMLVSRDGHVWMALRNGGMVGYDFNGTPLEHTDDVVVNLTTTVTKGDLPSEDVNCLEEDQNGAIWIGTEIGLTVLFNPLAAFQGGDYDTRPILVEQGGNVELLLGAEAITAIKIDGANRKWIGTRNGGVFLMSADGTEQIHHFTRENSPLLSNSINDIAIDHKTGEVFFATERGLLSYRSDATKPQEFFTEIKVFPNPVHTGYSGPISFTGLLADTDVKITDVAGNLVFKTTSNGGQATWFGNDLQGNRVKTGVYLIFAADKNGQDSAVGKVLFIQ